MRINLNSIIHPIDDFSEFEEFCKLKIRKLDKMRNKIDKNNINSNLSNINLDKIKLKSFLKTDNNYFIDNDSHLYNKKKESVIDKNINPKKELKVHKLVEIIDYDINNINNKSSIINIANCFENFNISKNKSDNNLLMINNLTKKLNKPKKTQSFLKPDDCIIPDNNNGNLISSKNENLNSKYKQYFDNNNSFNINNNFSNKYYRYKKNRNNINSEIKSKIEESVNYLYNLYPNLKMKKEL